MNYHTLFETGKKYKCKVVSQKGNSCQLEAERIPAQLLGLAANFTFPDRPVFSAIVGCEGICTIDVNPKTQKGLIAQDIILKL